MNLLTNIKPVGYLLPRDINGLEIGPDRIFHSLKAYRHVAILIGIGNLAGDLGLHLKQAKNIEGGSLKDLAFTKIYKQDPNSDDDVWNPVTVSSNLHTFANASDDNTNWCIELDDTDLDVTNDYDCFRVELNTAAAATLCCIQFLFMEPRFAGRFHQQMPSTRMN